MIQFLLFRSTNDFTALTCNDDKGDFINLRKIGADITTFDWEYFSTGRNSDLEMSRFLPFFLNFLNIFLFRKQAKEASYKSCTTRLCLEMKTKYKNYLEKELVSACKPLLLIMHK